MPLDLNVLAAVPETVPGTRQAPSLASNALVAFNYAPVPIQSGEVRRAIDLPFPGRRPALKTGVLARHPFSVELSGAGTAAGVPFWAPLLRGCMFGASVPNASINCAHPLNSVGDGGALSFDGWKDNVRMQAFGMRGNAVFDFTEKALPRIDFDYLGLIVPGAPATANTPGAVTLPTYPAPVEVNLANTAVILDGFTLGCRSFSLDLGMKTTLYSTTGSRSIIFDKAEDGDRRSAGGTLVAELPDPTAKSYFADVLAGTARSFSVAHGTVAGNIITIASSVFVPLDITFSVDANRILMTMPFALVPTAANNDFTLVTS